MNKSANKYKLIVSDLDGTIFDKTYSITREFAEIVQRVREKGCEFTFATGRLYPSAVKYAVELGIKIPLITYNGALIRDPITGITVAKTLLPKEKALEILNITENQGVMRFVFVDDLVYTDADTEITRGYADALRVKFETNVPLKAVVNENPIMMTLRDNPKEIQKWTRQFRDRYGDSLYFANSRPFFLDIAHPKVSKGYALKYLSQYLGINPNRVIAIGDEDNDLEMMKVAGLGVAVANASQIVRAAADYVTKGQYWRGVIEVLEKFVL